MELLLRDDRRVLLQVGLGRLLLLQQDHDLALLQVQLVGCDRDLPALIAQIGEQAPVRGCDLLSTNDPIQQLIDVVGAKCQLNVVDAPM